MKTAHAKRLVAAAMLAGTLAGCGDTSAEGQDAQASLGTSQAGLVTLNPIEYFRNTTGYPTLRNPNASWDFVSMTESSASPDGRQRIFYTKNQGDGQQFERFAIYGNYITLERDTSWPAADGRGNDAYDILPYGGLIWSKVNGQVARQHDGETSGYEVFTSDVTIAGYNHQNLTCRYDDSSPFAYEWRGIQKWVEYLGTHCWGGNVGCRETIRIPHAGEWMYYAKGAGWVAWRSPAVTDPNKLAVSTQWTVFDGTRIAPRDNCGSLGSWAGSMRDTSTMRTNQYGDWASCRGKVTCAPGEGIGGISKITWDDHMGRNAVCRRGNNYSGTYAATLTATQRRYERTSSTGAWSGTDWAYGYWKLECGADEYVAGVSQNAQQCQGNRQFHAILCAKFTAPLRNTTCTTRVFENGDDRFTNNLNPVTTGDWDFGAAKGECGLNEVLVGVSVNPSNGRPRGLLCCHRG